MGNPRLIDAVVGAIKSADRTVGEWTDGYPCLRTMLAELSSQGESVLATALAYRDHGGCCGDEQALTLLHKAAYATGYDMRDALLINAPSERESDDKAARAAEVISLLVAHGADPNIRAIPTPHGYDGNIIEDSQGSRPLHVATRAVVARALLDGGADPAAEDDQGVSAAACLLSNPKAWLGGAADVLIAAGHEHAIEPVEHVHFACAYGTVEEARRAWAQRCSPKERARTAFKKGLQKALCSTSATGRVDAVRFLLDEASVPPASRSGGMCALECASLNGHVDVVRLLVEHGAAEDGKGLADASAIAARALRKEPKKASAQQIVKLLGTGQGSQRSGGTKKCAVQ